MKRLSKIILIALASLLVLSVLAVVGLRTYVQGDSGRARLEEALGKALKIPVKFQRVAIEWPSKLRVEGVTTVETGAAGQPKLTAAALEGTLALRPLLSGAFEVRDIVIDGPSFDWPQDADERWTWPSPEKIKTPGKPSEPKTKSPSRKASVLVRGIKLTRGTVVMRNSKQEPVITADEVATEFSEINAEQLVGVVTASRMAWGGKYAFEQVRMTVRYADDKLVLDEFTATSFGGAVRGRYEMDTAADGQPFKTRIELRGVDLAALGTAAGWGDGEVSGRLSGEADVTGRTDRIARLEGPGRVRIEGGRFKKLEMLDPIVQLLGIGEMANFQPREVSAEFELRDEKTFIDPLVLAADNLRIAASGEARFDGKLKLDARLSVSERMVRTLPELAGRNFKKLDDGQYGLDFKVSGQTDRPKTDLAEKLIGGPVKDKIGELLGGLFGGAPKDDKEKKDADKRTPKPDAENP